MDEQFKVGLRAERGQGGHGLVQLGEGGLHVANALVDGLALLQKFNAAFAHEPRGIDEAVEVHPAVLDGELGVRREQLFLLVEDGVPMLLLLHVVVEAVALEL